MIENLTKQVKDLQVAVDNSSSLEIDTDYISDAVEERINKALENFTTVAEIDTNEVAATVEQTIKENMPQEEKTHEETVKIFYGVSSLKDVREQFKDELLNCNERKDVLRVITKYIPYCWMGGRKIKTVARYYADMRNVIKDVNDEYQDLALELFSVPVDVYERIKKADTEKVLEKLDTQETFDLIIIENTINILKKYINTALELGTEATVEDYKNNGVPIAKQQKVEQARAYLFASYLALTTGRRNTEILKNLELVKKKDGWYYKGVDKKGVPDIEIKAVALDDDFKFLNSLLEQLRKDVKTDNLTNQEVNSKYNHIFNRSFKRITGLNYTFHDAREIYAEIAYIRYGKKKNTEREEQDYKADILGHEIDKDRLITTDHYRTMKAE